MCGQINGDSEIGEVETVEEQLRDREIYSDKESLIMEREKASEWESEIEWKKMR